jgi:hypothetical protein
VQFFKKLYLINKFLNYIIGSKYTKEDEFLLLHTQAIVEGQGHHYARSFRYSVLQVKRTKERCAGQLSDIDQTNHLTVKPYKYNRISRRFTGMAAERSRYKTRAEDSATAS